MYSKLKNVQVIISLLKQNGIKHLVLSPGTRDVPLVHSVEQDSFFKCYSMVDERSAAYFALGLAKQLNEPVCLSCTSSTATCNYFPAVQEAFNTNVPLILLTADRNNYLLKQGEDQLIEQERMYGEYVRSSVNLPIVKNELDLKYCIRKVNEAILEINRGKIGPVQINFQVQEIDLCREKELPIYRKVTRLRKEDNWDEVISSLKKFNRIMIIFGQGYYQYNEQEEIRKRLDKFCKNNNCIVSIEETSNIESKYALKTCLVTEAMTDTEFKKYAPDLVITLGNHFFSFIKYKLRNISGSITHWRIAENGSYLDNFDALTTIFECTPLEFLDKIEYNKNVNINEYYHLWKNRIDEVQFPDLKFSNFLVVKKFAERIPKNSIAHFTILNSIRLFNFTNKKKIRAFCNLGADGIDGGMSTFLGQANFEDNLAFIVTGDLSFFYDLNSSLLKHRDKIRVLLINNYAGSEFHNNFGLEKIATLNDFIAAGHKSKAEYFSQSTDYKYYSALDEKELEDGLNKLFSYENNPIILEVFTNANQDSMILKEFYNMNCKLTFREYAKKQIKVLAKKILKRLKLR